ncbi:hypothetical protein J1N35_011809 [Gossypium stocksii]|uniref:Uncharacterized protein n=1 Tax=Gossypium stocksii TaxID=47602 RepID=A0A9D3W317_9ROSI|nr:hypothetical protein J1N35_011809 [Gossypium stocksii]
MSRHQGVCVATLKGYHDFYGLGIAIPTLNDVLIKFEPSTSPYTNSITALGGGRKVSRSRGVLLALQGPVTDFEESKGDVKETLEVVEGRIDELDLMREQLREYVQRLLVPMWK